MIAQRMAFSAMLLPSAKIEVFSVLSIAQRKRFIAEFGEDAVRRSWAPPDRPYRKCSSRRCVTVGPNAQRKLPKTQSIRGSGWLDS